MNLPPMLELSRKDESAVGMMMGDPGVSISDPDNLFALIYRKNELQHKLVLLQATKDEDDMFSGIIRRYQEAVNEPERKIMQYCSPVLQKAMTDEARYAGTSWYASAIVDARAAMTRQARAGMQGPESE